jgi:hypothetical protein
MKRLVITLVTIAFLTLTATAVAQECRMATRIGSAWASQTTTGGCTTARNKLLGTETLRCGAGSGAAVVRYGFKLPDGCGPGVTAHVDAAGHTSVGVSSGDGKVRVAVRVTGPYASATVSMVSINYYC